MIIKIIIVIFGIISIVVFVAGFVVLDFLALTLAGGIKVSTRSSFLCFF